MRNISLVFTMLILIGSMYLYKSQIINCASAQAQEIQQSTTPEPNVMNQLEKILEEILKPQEPPKEVNKPEIVHLTEVEIEKLDAQDIEAKNIRYKNRIFGNPFCGLAMSIEPKKAEYEIGENIEISILYRNFSKENNSLRWDRSYGDIEDCSYAMYFPDGNPVYKSELIEKYEANINKPLEFPRSGSNMLLDLRPRQIYTFTKNISRYFKIEKEGTYSLVIIRNITGSWQDGFMISNMTKINIVSKKEN
jgi:hypothetical protein